MTIEVETPDGAVIEFPAGTPPEQIQAAMKTYSQRQNASKFYNGNPDEAGTIMKTLGGAKHAWDRGALGLKGLFTGLTPEDKAQLQQGRDFVDYEGGAAKVGNFAGDVALTAGPAKALYGAGVKLLPKALQGYKAARAAIAAESAATSGAAVGALTSPEDRQGGAVGGAIGGLVGQGAGVVLNKALGGVARGMVSPEAQALMNQGVNVPLWKATNNRVVRDLAERAQGVPIVGGIMQRQEREAIQQWNKALLDKANPMLPVLDGAGRVMRWERTPVRGEGQQAVTELKERFGKAYDALYEGRVAPLDPQFDQALSKVSSEVRAYTPSIADDIDGAIRRMNDTIRPGTGAGQAITSTILGVNGQPIVTGASGGHVGATYDALRRARFDLDGSIKSAWQKGDAEKATALEAVRSSLNDLQNRALPPELAPMKAEIDNAYRTFKRVERASSSLGAAREGGVFTPQQALNASRALDPSANKSAFAQGRAPVQPEAQAAHQVLGSRLPEVGPGTAEKGIFAAMTWLNPKLAVPAALMTPTGQRVLAGNTGLQRYARTKEEVIADLLRNSGIVGGQQMNTEQ